MRNIKIDGYCEWRSQLNGRGWNFKFPALVETLDYIPKALLPNMDEMISDYNSALDKLKESAAENTEQWHDNIIDVRILKLIEVTENLLANSVNNVDLQKILSFHHYLAGLAVKDLKQSNYHLKKGIELTEGLLKNAAEFLTQEEVEGFESNILAAYQILVYADPDNEALYKSKINLIDNPQYRRAVWTESQLQQMARLRKSGKTFQQIADILGGISRTIVLTTFVEQNKFRVSDLFGRKRFERTVEALASERMIFCESCGGKISKTAKFCSNCGASIIAAEVETETVSNKTSAWLEKRGLSEDANSSAYDDTPSIMREDDIENIPTENIEIPASAAHRTEQKEDNTRHISTVSLKQNAVEDDKEYGFFDFIETGQTIWGVICLLFLAISGLGIWFATMAPSPESAVETTAAVEKRLAEAEAEAERLEAQNQVTRVDTEEEVLAFEAAKSSKRITNLGEFYVNYPDSKNRNTAKQLALASLQRQNSDLARKTFVKYFGALPVTQTVQNDPEPEPESNKVKFDPETQKIFDDLRVSHAKISAALSENRREDISEDKIYKEISYTGPRDFDGEPHGIGKMVFQEGVVYEGQFEHGKRVKGETRFPDGSSHTGGYLGIYAHGFGIQTEATGETYKGIFKNGNFHGQGVYTFADGGEYNGLFEDGDFHGQGLLTLINGDEYEGMFKKGKRHGQGVYTFVDGTVQSGEFRDGDLNGQGRAISPDSFNYVGGFKDGVFHGQGTLIETNGKRYEGSFANGEKNGQGLTIFETGGSYKGQCKADLAHGEGVYDGPELDVIIHGIFNQGDVESYTCQDRSGGSKYACEDYTLTVPC